MSIASDARALYQQQRVAALNRVRDTAHAWQQGDVTITQVVDARRHAALSGCASTTIQMAYDRGVGRQP